jgi:hypothetical protein
MNKNTKTVLTLVGVSLVVAAVFHFGNASKKRYAKVIIKLNGTSGSYATLLTMDEGYLRAWAKALGKGKQNFSYAGETYSSSGGKKIVV